MPREIISKKSPQTFFCAQPSLSSRSTRGIHKRGMHEKVKFTYFYARFYSRSKEQFAATTRVVDGMSFSHMYRANMGVGL